MPKTSAKQRLKGAIGHRINKAVGEGNAKEMKGKVLDLVKGAIRKGVTEAAGSNGLSFDVPFGMKKKKKRSHKKKK